MNHTVIEPVPISNGEINDMVHDMHQTYTVDSQNTIINISSCNNPDWKFKHTVTTTIISTYTML
jgi:hypothetical protein